MVPTGTFKTTLAPSRPVLFAPSPWRPRSALCSGLKRKCTSVLWRSLDSMTTSPPRPPSPPEGPPRGTNVSRLHPNFGFIDEHGRWSVRGSRALRTGWVCRLRLTTRPSTHDKKKSPARSEAVGSDPSRSVSCHTGILLRFHRLNHHELSHRPLVHELDPARDLGKQGIVLAAPDVETGFYPRPPLAHDDRSARNDLPAECLESKPLRIRVAAVS